MHLILDSMYYLYTVSHLSVNCLLRALGLKSMFRTITLQGFTFEAITGAKKYMLLLDSTDIVDRRMDGQTNERTF